MYLNYVKRKIVVKYKAYNYLDLDTLVTLLQQEIDELQPLVV